ncbi:hypothetical protein C2S53_000628 [Perilla frutescens var. hirtella]|uniref:RING-type domain-containing protein n=1 Tax=Perilla frutescens var. hirtella TaxID=608512 RepID=A0AAD4NYH2_PERFH|nr:hypothetical protein C2S53_000628 [Perilla frutescens var. hirtella]
MFSFSLHISTLPLSSPSLSPTAAAPDQQPRQWALDFNIVVIIAAVICAALCALGLNSMLQCILQCTYRALTGPVGWIAARRLNSGLRKKDVVSLPTSVYPGFSSSSSSSSSSTISNCAICLLDFCDGDNIRILPNCNHGFHVACIDKWLLSHSSCPTCRLHLKPHNHIIIS